MDKIITITIIGIYLFVCAIITQPASANEKSIEGFDCVRTYCGCKEDVEIRYETTIVSSNFIPQPNIKVSCPQSRILGVTNESGKIAFTLKTVVSPGCGLECGELTFTRETSVSYEAWKINIDTTKNQTILGQHYQKGERRNDENDGIWQEWCTSRQWSSTGKLRVSGNYKDGMKDGMWTEWYCSGNIRSQKEYRNGSKEGLWREWYGNGQLKIEVENHNDKRHGKMTSWYPNGKMESESEFRNGKYYGVRKYYSRDGTIEYMDSKGFIIRKE